jgi:small subunit ribosomal protein S1
MIEDSGRGIPRDPTVEESYWASLFQTEEAADFNGVSEADPPEAFLAWPQDQFDAVDKVWPAGDSVAEPAKPVPSLPAATTPMPDPWDAAQFYMEQDRPLKLKILGHNKGGLLVSWNGLQGFVPASQLVDFPQFHIPRQRIHSLGDWVGRTLALKIIEVNKPNSRLILSERAALVAAEQREVLWQELRPGDKLEGVVTNLTDFGAFVDLGGIEGLIHISEISWSRIAHPSAALQPGQNVKVVVLSIDERAKRIALSMKRLRPDPWATADERYRPGQRVTGVVSDVTTYGAFVVLEQELEGLVHISELAEGVIKHPQDVVRSGQQVVARVLSVDSGNKRIALSLRAAGDNSAAP